MCIPELFAEPDEPAKSWESLNPIRPELYPAVAKNVVTAFTDCCRAIEFSS